MLCVPASSVEIVRVATPLLLRLQLPMFAVPSQKVTVPAGMSLKPPEVTVAVKVTDCPELDGLSEEARAVVVGPRLVLMSTPTIPLLQLLLLGHTFTTTRSGLPSPFTSAIAADSASYPPER